MTVRGATSWRVLLPVLLLTVITVVGTRAAGAGQEAITAPNLGAYLLAAAASLLLLGLRWPRIVLPVNGLLVGIYLALGFPFGPILLTSLLMALVAGLWHSAREAIVPSAIATVPALIGVALRGIGSADETLWDSLQFAGIWTSMMAAAVTVGVSVRARRLAMAEAAAARLRRAASEESLRMAKDLHDTVGHALAVVAMQSGVALHLLNSERLQDTDTERVRALLTTIRDTSRESLDGVRRELSQLRTSEEPRRRPEPGLDDLPEMIERVRAAGPAVSLDIRVGQDVPGQVAVVGYRIVQESLTNVLRHSGAASAAVVVRSGDGRLYITVTDAGRAAGAQEVRDDADLAGDPHGPGRSGVGESSGIAGMRSRATGLGGTLDAGPIPDGGFRVTASLPLPSAQSSPSPPLSSSQPAKADSMKAVNRG